MPTTSTASSNQKHKRSPKPLLVILALLVAVAVIVPSYLVFGSGSRHGVANASTAAGTSTKKHAKAMAKPKKLGAFNPADYAHAPKAPLGEIGPGACLPGNTFDNMHGTAEVVNYLLGKNPADTKHLSLGVAHRDVSWLNAHADYYHYKANANFTDARSDAQYMSELTLVQLTQPITVLDTYCPSGGNTVLPWRVETLPVGEWVWFLKGHAPGDGRAIIPVRKAVCGNWLLPPPSSTKPSPKLTSPGTTPSPSGTTPVTTVNTSPPGTTSPPTYGCPAGEHKSPLNGVCIVPKDPSKDPQRNPSVPPIGKGHGTTPSGGSPGPATPPVTTPTGCDGACPSPTTPTTKPTPTTSVTAPPSTIPTLPTTPNTGSVPPPKS